jgi:hypothetical protein
LGRGGGAKCGNGGEYIGRIMAGLGIGRVSTLSFV